jgi:prepilin-type N-terminal cleavage/methylation domain-containing protein
MNEDRLVMASTLKLLRRPWGFTFVEVLVAIAVIGVLGGVAYVNFTGAQEGTGASKLENDVRVLNNAIDSYLAAGGSLTNATTAGAVLDKLKTVATDASAERTLGVTGSFVDPRTTIVLQTAAEGNSAVRRAFFTNSSPPRFYTASAGGVGIKEFAFDEVAAGATAATETRTRTLDQASTDGWVWDYNDRTVAAAPAGLVPTAVDVAGGTTNVGQTIIQLNPPTFSPVEGAYTLADYPLPFRIDDPNDPTISRIYYSLNGSPYVLFNTPFTIDPDTSVSAQSVSLDPSRYSSSTIATANYTLTPLLLTISLTAPVSVTYAQAGGAMLNQPAQTPLSATVALTPAIPAPYLTSSNFNIRYTLNGSTPSAINGIVGPAFSDTFESPSIPLGISNFGTNASINIQAMAVTLRPSWFISSGVVQRTVTAQTEPMTAPMVFPTNQVVTASVTVVMSNPLTGPATNMIIRYTTNGTTPSLTNGIVYSGPFSLSSFAVNEQKSVRAVTFPPSGLTNWFTPSPATVRTYTGPSSAGSGIPSGALVASATLNSTFNGNVTIAYPTNGSVADITYNKDAVINGSLYVPGTPRVAQNTPYITNWTPALDAQFANRIYGIVEGQSPSPRVVNLTGPTTPTNYVITFNNNSYITGKIFRRIERYTLTRLNVATFPAKTSSATLNLNGPVGAPLSATNVADVTLNTGTVGSVPLLPGTYGNMTANNNSKFVLGNATNPDVIQTYSFDSLQLNSEADLVIVGRVVLNIRNGFAINNGSVLGNVANPDWLQINVWNGNVAANSGSSIYGRLYVPGHRVDLNNGSVLNGSVSANALQINSSATVFSLSPSISPTP